VIAGIGVDMTEISRLESALARTPGLTDRLFAQSERRSSVRELAGSFAAKEALAKALGAPRGLRWTDVVLHREPSGRPVLEITGTVAVAAADQGISAWHVSISHDGGFCLAMVVAER
jgi:holo-[acyl-carrier protein] synthase